MLRTLRLSLIFILPGVVVAAIWIFFTGGSVYWSSLVQAKFVHLLAMLSITAFCIFVRFFRWQFLLRRAGIRLQTRPSFSIFIASLLGIATPAYAGEIIRSVFLREKFRVSMRTSGLVLILERLFDVTSLSLLAVITARSWELRAFMILLILGAAVLAFTLKKVGQFAGVSSKTIESISQPVALSQALFLSLVAWVPTGLLIRLAAESSGIWVSLLHSIYTFSSATLLGGLTLLPAGIGVTGSMAIVNLQEAGLKLPDAVVVVSLVRLCTIGFTLMLGSIFLVRELRGLKRTPTQSREEHFDEISGKYQDEFSPHIWNHLLQRRLHLLVDALPRSNPGIGLDVGCGLGQICLSMESLGFRVIGLDSAQKLLVRAKAAGVPAVNGSALALPFPNESFEFIYIVGAFHHFGNRKSQGVAFKELHRVLKGDGYLIVHETNPRNPLFRFYMGYIFPLLKSIDEGNEWWVEPERWQTLNGMELLKIKYFTFLPDFVPAFLMKPFLGIQRRLEETRLRYYSAHYMVVLQKTS